MAKARTPGGEREKRDQRRRLSGWNWLLMGIPRPQPDPSWERGCFSQKSQPLAGVGDASQWSEYGRLDPRQRADARHLLPSL